MALLTDPPLPARPRHSALGTAQPPAQPSPHAATVGALLSLLSILRDSRRLRFPREEATEYKAGTLQTRTSAPRSSAGPSPAPSLEPLDTVRCAAATEHPLHTLDLDYGSTHPTPQVSGGLAAGPGVRCPHLLCHVPRRVLCCRPGHRPHVTVCPLLPRRKHLLSLEAPTLIRQPAHKTLTQPSCWPAAIYKPESQDTNVRERKVCSTVKTEACRAGRLTRPSVSLPLVYVQEQCTLTAVTCSTTAQHLLSKTGVWTSDFPPRNLEKNSKPKQ